MTEIMTPTCIEMKNVHKAFGSKVVLDGFDLEIKKGESVVIIGGSGSGKSVSLKSILGLLTPDSGDITIDGKSVLSMSGSAREKLNNRVGMLFQNAALFDSLNVWENVSFALMEGEKLPRKKAKEIAIEKLSLVGLSPEVANMSPAELSGGMRKRVGLARAIAHEPDIIFFDEPTTGLDPIMGHVIDDLITHCVKTLGASALTITHDMASARRIADRVTMLYQGKNIWTGPVDQLDDSGNPYVHQFINGLAEGPIELDISR
ncbi:ABC transporter ATP-binding protein [Curvivirga aplysinae]|uniref:ABC transporter ATP-binding protein n=1 Tax=Curvivirga aplysinae TaxID=2529852 RepID=UPI001F212BBA|nr:ATP-binding cassette domain-containing protein [Curvivirga aplysinae]